MATLKTGSGSIEVSNGRVVCQAERMFKLSEPRRAHRLERAKAALATGATGGKGGKTKGTSSPAARRAAAIVLSQGINEL